MFKKYHLLSKRNICYFFIFTVLICLFCISQKNIRSRLINRTPANIFMNPYVVPVGTQMVVPPWIMQQYQSALQKKIYGNVLDYLIYNYSVSALDESGESTYYIPLSISSSYDDDDDDYDYDVSPIRKGDIYMVDVTKVKVTTPAPAPAPTPTPAVPAPTEPPSDAPSATSSGEAVEPQPPAEPQLPAEGGGAERPVDESVDSSQTPVSSETSEELQFITTEFIDPSTAPPPPSTESEPKLEPVAEKPPVSCDESDVNTEADSPCVECAGLSETEVKPFLEALETKVGDSHSKKNFPGVIRDICRSCGVDAKNFFQYIRDRAKEEGIPSEVLFALVMRESNGNCKAGGDGGKSVGLFQLNTGNSTCLEGCKAGALEGVSEIKMRSVCEKGKYHEKYGKPGVDPCPGTPSSSDPKICLNNPYCNFEEAFHLLIDQKWGIGNNKETYKPTNKKWENMKAEERNKWRNAIVAYNGIEYIQRAENSAENLMNIQWQNMNVNEKRRWVTTFVDVSKIDIHSDTIPRSLLDNWEFKRIFFMRQYLDSSSETSEAVLRNLAHVESITGREVSGGFAESAICQWVQFEEENQNLSCK